jgi:hypothetical protein
LGWLVLEKDNLGVSQNRLAAANPNMVMNKAIFTRILSLTRGLQVGWQILNLRIRLIGLGLVD